MKQESITIKKVKTVFILPKVRLGPSETIQTDSELPVFDFGYYMVGIQSNFCHIK
jgi:hypothetical protein